MADRPYIYSGQGFSLLRDKNRFVLPAAFRSTVKESSGGRPALYLAKHDRWECLVGYGESRIGDFDQQIRDEEERAVRAGREYDAEKRAMDLYNYSEVPFDGSGRFVLPEVLATLGDVGDQLYFHGAGRFFTLWNPEALYAMDDSWRAAQVACRNLAAKEAAKVKK
ncbi:division/cell wall cluster transcriptional repressor MraZ [Novosphingobium sp. 9]|uniref:division/cell wall cluster transcriptional repressor MraZ n=1 Tax=Novosphingobium sp. 9 TaxID=2025349 RepID=UPI0021B5732C|nr:division/cell wall cluster transcriptional repressor MraZ [Novosphingobium sp. 9]